MTTLIAAFALLKILTVSTKAYNKAVKISAALEKLKADNMTLTTFQT
jgi:hypothetical protein